MQLPRSINTISQEYFLKGTHIIQLKLYLYGYTQRKASLLLVKQGEYGVILMANVALL